MNPHTGQSKESPKNVKQSALGMVDFHLNMSCFSPKKQRSIFQIFQDLDLVQENFSEERLRWICCYGIRQMLPLRSLRVYRFSFSQGACGVDFSISLLGSQRIPKALMDFGCWSLSLQEMDLPMLRRWMLTMRRMSQRNVFNLDKPFP